MPDNKLFSILDIEGFSAGQPYAEGLTIDAAEAKVLNQVRKENLANNFRAAVQDFKDGKPDAAKSEAELLAAFSALDADYKFTLTNAGGSRKLEPWEREARSLVRPELKAAIAADSAFEAQFKAMSETDQKDWFDAKLDEIIESNADIQKAAKKIVADRQKAAKTTIGALSLSGSGDGSNAAAQ